MRKAFQPAVAGSVADFYHFDAVHVDASIWDTEEDFSEEEKQNMRSLMDDPSQIEEPGMDEEEKSLMKQLIEGLSGMFEGGPIRGLNELEVAEFEAAWNKL